MSTRQTGLAITADIGMEESINALENAARLAGEKGLIRFTRFLDPAEVEVAKKIARRHGAQFAVWGGYDRAERVSGCFYPYGEQPAEAEYPVVCLHSTYPAKFCSVSHRDLLGAFMALGLTRSCLGDIIIVGADIYLFAYAQIADFIVQSMSGAGRAKLDFCMLDQAPVIPDPEGTRFSAVVSSLRLDGVIAAAYKLSRGESADMIRAGMVKLDHLPCDHVDAAVKEGALLSLRGKGRVRLMSIDGTTRKQRIGVTFFRYE